MEFTYYNVNDQFAGMFDVFKHHGVEAESRNGRVLRIPEPVMTHILYPNERVLFHRGRDANPIFHLFEALWMLSGSDLVAPLSHFNSRIHEYSDDGIRFNGAYGHRMRRAFHVDQLMAVIQLLRTNPTSRQAVIQLWSSDDLVKNTLDKCCNMLLVCEIQDGALNMTTYNRSNDAWWGYAGANAVHFTIIQQFIAEAVGVRLGRYTTVSTNLHLYLDLYDAQEYLDYPPVAEDFVTNYAQCEPYDLLQGAPFRLFLEDCRKLMNGKLDQSDFRSPFIQHTMLPMMYVTYARKSGETGLDHCRNIHSQDWREATFSYIANRENKKNGR